MFRTALPVQCVCTKLFLKVEYLNIEELGEVLQELSSRSSGNVLSYTTLLQLL